LFNGEYKGAVQAYERVVELKPDWGYAYNNLGVARLNWALSGQGGPQDLSDFGKAIAQAGEDANLAVLAYYNQSDGLLWQGNNDKRAEAACQQALDTKATSALPHVCFALYRFVHFTNAKAAIPYGDIETDLKQAQESSGDLPARFYCLRARWNWDRRQWQAARDDYWHCLSLMQHRACLPNDRQYVEKATDSLRQLSR